MSNYRYVGGHMKAVLVNLLFAAILLAYTSAAFSMGPLAKEGVERYSKLIENQIKICGDSIFNWAVQSKKVLDEKYKNSYEIQRVKSDNAVREAKHWSFHCDEEQQSLADKMNGLQWSGECYIKFLVSRSYSLFRPYDRSGQWA